MTVDTESINPNVKQADYGGGRGRGSSKSPMPTDRPASSTGVYVKIPAKYAKKSTSPLKATLTAGDQKQDFELTD